MVPVPDRPGDRADELEGGTGAAAGRGQPEGVGWQPDDGGSAGAGRGDVGVGNRPPTTAGTGGLHHRRLAGIRQPTPPQTRAANGAVNKYAKSLHRQLLAASTADNREMHRIIGE